MIAGLSHVYADSPGGTTTLRQTLSGIFPGERYALVAYFGFSGQVNNEPSATIVRVIFDGIEILASFKPCTAEFPCSLPGGSGSFYKRGPIPVVPTSPAPILTLNYVSTIPAGVQGLDFFTDSVTLTKE